MNTVEMTPTLTPALPPPAAREPGRIGRGSQRGRRRAFTLVEILVAIGIIVLLVAIAIPAVIHAWRAAQKTRVAADLQSISAGLEAYKLDFGDYPRPPGWQPTSAGGIYRPFMNSGFAILGQALVAPGSTWTVVGGNNVPSSQLYTAGRTYEPGDCVYVTQGTSANEFVAVAETTGQTPPGSNWAPSAPVSPDTVQQSFPYTDGGNGPGFRARPGGRVYGPYLSPERFKLRGVALLDNYGNPILYFPHSGKKPNPGQAAGVLIAGDPSTTPAQAALQIYDSTDNVIFFKRPGDANANGRSRMSALLGDVTAPHDGIILPPEVAATDANYLLWSAGPDGFYGVNAADPTNITKDEISKCDDITNFR